ncbi:MAG: metalloregulator ArsR/SmtB family transcription factor [Caldilineaceae bacterium]
MDMLLTLLKELADATRLTILGLLAEAPRSGDELATLIDLKPSTISHHLMRLQKARLVTVTAEQYYHVYSLEPTALTQLQQLLTPDQLAAAVQQGGAVDNDAYRQQILTRWIQSDRLQDLPTQVKQRAVVLQWLAEKFVADQRYSPQQLDDVLDRWCSWQNGQRMDITTITRTLVEMNLLDRTRDGRWYWRADSVLAQGVEGFSPDLLPPADTSALHMPMSMSTLRKLVQVALRIKANQPFSTAALDRLLTEYRKDPADDVAEMRSAMLNERLLQHNTAGQYLRPTIGPDHPAMGKLRAEALARHSETESRAEK